MADDLLLTAAQMRAWERAAIESGAVTALELMERAGRGAVDAIFAEWPELATSPGRAVVLCGPGNNGGDGFVVARVLAGQGWAVEVFLYGDARKLPPDARTNYERWREMGAVEVLTVETFEARGRLVDCDLLVDALFGIGLSRPVALPLASLEPSAEAGSTHRIVALDVPSGLNGDVGRVVGDGASIRAALTIAFHAAKLGHYLARGPASCGRVRVVDIGLNAIGSFGTLPEEPEDHPAGGGGVPHAFGSVWTPSPQEEGNAEPPPVRLVAQPGADVTAKADVHKYHYGHALVVTGGFGRTGAARLSARAALRIGAGLVTVAAPGAAMMECACQLTAIMLRRCDDADALGALLEDDRLNALCLGPGLGTDERAAGLVAAALASGRACVLDADALTVIAGDDALRAGLHSKCVLTPHAGEFARLFPDIAARLDAPVETGPACSKVDATRDAAAAAGCTIVHKGPDTVIAGPDGRASVNAAVYDRAAPWLATAGTGDVLAGMVTGLLARGLAPHEAAASAAWLHVEAALSFGPGLIAEDLPERLPAVLAALAASEA